MAEGDRPLIFHWGAGRNRVGKLWVFVGVSVLAHLLVFYLIRVMDPVVERWSPHTSEIALLSAQDELVLPLLRELEDRTYHLHPGQGMELSSGVPGSLAPAFRPSFANHRIELRPLFSSERRHALMGQEAVVEDELEGLPPRPQPREGVVMAPEAIRTAYLNFGPELVWRKFEVDRERLAVWFREGQPLYFRVYAGVSPRGEVQVMSVAEEFEGRITPGELELVRQSLRFEPAKRWAWDWIEIQR